MTTNDCHQRSMRRKFEKVTETTEVDINDLVESVNKVSISSDERTCDKSLKKLDDYVGEVEKELKDLCIKPALAERENENVVSAADKDGDKQRSRMLWDTLASLLPPLPDQTSESNSSSEEETELVKVETRSGREASSPKMIVLSNTGALEKGGNCPALGSIEIKCPQCGEFDSCTAVSSIEIKTAAVGSSKVMVQSYTDENGRDENCPAMVSVEINCAVVGSSEREGFDKCPAVSNIEIKTATVSSSKVLMQSNTDELKRDKVCPVVGSIEINCAVVGSSDIKTTEMASQNLFVIAKKDIDTTGPKETDDTNIKTTRFRSGGVYSFHKGKGHKTPARKRLVEVLQLQATEQASQAVPTSPKAEVLNAKPSSSRGQDDTTSSSSHRPKQTTQDTSREVQLPVDT